MQLLLITLNDTIVGVAEKLENKQAKVYINLTYEFFKKIAQKNKWEGILGYLEYDRSLRALADRIKTMEVLENSFINEPNYTYRIIESPRKTDFNNFVSQFCYR